MFAVLSYLSYFHTFVPVEMDHSNFYSLDFLGIHPLHLSFHTGLYRVSCAAWSLRILEASSTVLPCCLFCWGCSAHFPMLTEDLCSFFSEQQTLTLLVGSVFFFPFFFIFPPLIFFLSWGEKSQIQTLPVQECPLNACPWAVGSGNFRWDLAAGSQPRQGSHVRPGPHLLFPSPRRQRNVLTTGSFCHDSLLSAWGQAALDWTPETESERVFLL